MPIDPGELAAAIADLMGRGVIAGLGSGQNDTKSHADNVDATHALNIRYVVPSNCQRIVTARLSFHLAAFRDYDTAISTATTAAGPHVHYWSFGGSGTSAGGSMAVNGSGAIVNTGTSAGGKQTSSEHAVGSTGGSLDTSIEAFDNNGHTHTVTPTLTRGVFEGTVAAGVSVSFDGVDKTAALAGPWSVDVVELDITSYIQKTPDKKYHTIALTPSGLGRIEADLRINYFANAGIPA